MLNIHTFRAEMLPPDFAQGMVPLTNATSVNRQWITAIADEQPCDSMPADLLYAVAVIDDANNYEIRPVGWASLYVWDGVPCLEAFVDPAMRSRRIASICAAALLNSINWPVAEIGVFSDEAVAIAKWLHCQQIIRYRRVDDGWVKSHA